MSKTQVDDINRNIYDIKNKDGKLIGLRAFIDTLRNSNYKVNSKRKKIKNVLYTYYMITE